MNIKDIDKIRQSIEKEMKVVGERRDNLREILYELETYVQSLDESYDYLDSAIAELDNAIDTISQYI